MAISLERVCPKEESSHLRGTGLTAPHFCQSSRGQHSKAEPLYQWALLVLEKTLGADHPDITVSLHSLAELYRVQGRYDKAEPLYLRAVATAEKTLGPDHTGVAVLLENYATLLRQMRRESEAAAMQARAQVIRTRYIQQPSAP
jgi:tetratricopeptide (TPR) repeat protein